MMALWLVLSALPLRAELVRIDHVDIYTALNGYSVGVIDPVRQIAILGTRATEGQCRVGTVDLATGTFLGTIGLPNSSCWYPADALIDPSGDYAYFYFQFYNVGAPTNVFYKRVYRLDLSTMTWDGFLTLDNRSGAGPALMDPDGVHAYFVRSGGACPQFCNGADIYKVDLDSFTVVATLRLNSIEPRVHAAWIGPAGVLGYFVTDSTGSGDDLRVVRVDLDDMERVDSTPLPGGWRINAVVNDPVEFKAYLGTDSDPGVVLKVNYSVFEFGWEDSIALASGENELAAGVLDPSGRVAWFTTFTAPGRVVGIDLDHFERLGALTLADNENYPQVLLADPAEPFLYATTDNESVLGERLVRLRDLEGRPFVTTWQSDNPGVSGNAQIQIPTAGGGHQYHLHWESLDHAGRSGWLFDLTGSTTVDLEVIGRHRVSIYEDFPRIYFNNTGDRRKILSVEQWGDTRWSSMFNAFSGAEHLQIHASDAPDLSQASSIAHMFRGASSLNSDLSHWDVSTIANMQSVFNGASTFDRSLGDWAIDNVTNMTGMLANAGMSTASYDDTLIGWSGRNVQSGVLLTSTGLAYCAVAARQSLIADDGWSIIGDSQAAGCAGLTPGVPVLVSPPDSAVDVPIDPVLSWSASSGADVYDLQVATHLGFTEPVVDLSGLQATSQALSDLDFETLYYWRVRARNDAGASAYTLARKFTTEASPQVPPSPPALVSPPDQATDVPIRPLLQWADVTAADSYRLQLANDASFSQMVLDVSGIGSTSFELPELNYDTLYYWRVSAVNGAGSSSFSTTWRFETETESVLPPSAPEPIAPPDGAAGVTLNPVLVWDEPPAAETYRLQVSLNAAFSQLVLDEPGIERGFFELVNLDHATRYYWRVRAFNAVGSSNYSTPWQFTTEDEELPLPDAPELASPADGATGLASVVILGWAPVDGADDYQVQVATDAGFADPLLDVDGIASNSFQATGLDSGTEYHWRVRATNATGDGPFSATWTFTTGAGTATIFSSGFESGDNP